MTSAEGDEDHCFCLLSSGSVTGQKAEAMIRGGEELASTVVLLKGRRTNEDSVRSSRISLNGVRRVRGLMLSL